VERNADGLARAAGGVLRHELRRIRRWRPGAGNRSGRRSCGPWSCPPPLRPPGRFAWADPDRDGHRLRRQICV